MIPTPSPNTPMAPSRAGTLSWQQRPSSRGSTGSSSRPLSMLASEERASISPRVVVGRTPATDGKMSRNQISQSLGSKDPAWFKQTQDRGLGSAAFRRNQDDSPDTASLIGTKPLPGMSRESTADLDNRASSASDFGRSTSPPREGSIRGLSRLGHKYSDSASLPSAGGIGSLLPTMSSHRFDPPSSTSSSIAENSSIAPTLAMSPSQGRLSPERLDRPASPTKGLGGFVQSAMLKRSDSVSKRWSAQAGPILSRGNSIASNRNGYEGARYPMGGITSLKDSRPSSMSREHSTETSSRPGSSHSSATLVQGQIDNELATGSTHLTSIESSSFEDEALEPARVDSMSSPSSKQNMSEKIMSPPASPSKKWSPTKASWLENAINKPDTPKVMSPAPQQPAWMAEINRAKQQRANMDSSKGGHLTQEHTSRPVHSPPSFARNNLAGVSGLPDSFNANGSAEARVESPERANQRDESSKTTNAKNDPRESNSPNTPLLESGMKANSPGQSPADEKSADWPTGKKRESQLGSRTQSPKAAKPKPETPPKIDFKSRLKSRQASGEAKRNDEPEFKNVFGNLKRTQTQTYKAPNELKDNIMRGKAGLAMTGNPKKTERKDEFKESLLKKKEGMVVPSASTRITSASSQHQERIVPEAIARRQGLSRFERSERSERSPSKDDAEQAGEPTKAEALTKLQKLREKPTPVPPESPSSTVADSEEDPAPKGSLGGGFTSSLAGMLQRGPLAMANGGKPSLAHSFSDDQNLHSQGMRNDQEASAAGPRLKHATKARARGPKRRLPTASEHYATKDTSPSQREPQSELSVAESKSVEFTQSTKSLVSPHSLSKPEPRPLSNITDHNNNNRKTSQPSSPRKPSTTITHSLGSKTSSPTSQSHGKELQNKVPPIVKDKPIPSPKDTKASVALIPTSTLLPVTPLKQPVTREPLDVISGLGREQERQKSAPLEADGPTPSVKDAAASLRQTPVQPSANRSFAKLPTQKDEEAAQERAGLGWKGAAVGPIGLGIETPSVGPKPSLDRNLPSPVTPSPKSPPLPGRKPAFIVDRVMSTNHSPQASSAVRSPPVIQSTGLSQEHLSGASDLLSNLFDEHPSLKSNVSVDTQAVLNSRSCSDGSLKIKTLRKQIFEIIDNGKSVPVPSHQEHILFEGRLYLCTHVFGTLAGTRTTEVYLWCGDGVPSSSIEDAQLFAKKAAKDNNGKLIVLKQGKETTNFFQALGGIVITRRGSSSRMESSGGTAATYILCGRQHVGQIAFDEVDFSLGALCSGFPYIVSTRSGKLYLWKGSGSSADELGCARLIGMDLGLTGEIEEIDEGQEPDVFWQSFLGEKRDDIVSKGKSTWHWRLKPSCEKYTTRLYRTDVEAPRPKSGSGFLQWGRRGSAPADTKMGTTAQIREITPFAQSDLMDDGVFVLDAFFEIFM